MPVKMRRGGGVYVYRTRKPAARLRIPIVSYHFGYVGETNSFAHRHAQHLVGDATYGHTAKPWSDLDPRCVLRIPLPPYKPLLRAVETLLILCTWPVYNHRKNRWNPRRIPLRAAARQRAMRNRLGFCFNIRPVHLLAVMALGMAALYLYGGK